MDTRIPEIEENCRFTYEEYFSETIRELFRENSKPIAYILKLLDYYCDNRPNYSHSLVHHNVQGYYNRMEGTGDSEKPWSGERIEAVFAREAAEIMDRHMNDTDQATMKEELKRLTHRMFATTMFFANYRWYMNVKDALAKLKEKTEADPHFKKSLTALNELLAHEKHAWNRDIRIIDEIPSGLITSLGIAHSYIMPVKEIEHIAYQALGKAERGEDQKTLVDIRLLSTLEQRFNIDMIAGGYLILTNRLDDKANYDMRTCGIKKEIKEKAVAEGQTLDRVTAELGATLEFSSSVMDLRAVAAEGLAVEGGKLEKKIAPYENGGESLILYADDILESAAAMDLEDTVKDTLTSHNVLTDGKIILSGREEANTAILERMIRRANPNIEIIKKVAANVDEVEELKSLLAAASAKDTPVLAIVRGPSPRQNEFMRILADIHVPMVIVGREKGIYSFAEALAKAATRKTAADTPGAGKWVIVLDPVRRYSDGIAAQYDEYQRSLAALRNA